MGVFEHFPYTNFHEMNLDWLLKRMKELEETVSTFISSEVIQFADPIIWSISTNYSKSTVVMNEQGDAFLSKKDVPAGIQLNNSEYWLQIFNFSDYIMTANKNFTFNVETNTTRASSAYIEGDWLLWENVLYEVILPIQLDDAFIINVNIRHFTVEDFIKAWILSANNRIQQYKTEIDISEQEFTDNLQAQFDQVLAGATVDSEVINARIGYDNYVYTTLGNAIRGQISDLHYLYKCITDGVLYHRNVLTEVHQDQTCVKAAQSNNIIINSSPGWSYCIGIVEGGLDYSASMGYFDNVFSFYADRDHQFITYLQDVKQSNFVYRAPANAKYIYICSNRDLSNAVITQFSESILGYKAVDYPFDSTFNIEPRNVDNYRPIVIVQPSNLVQAWNTFNKFSDGLARAMALKNADLIVKNGTYDIVAELGSSIESGPLNLGGLKIGNNVRVYFEENAKLICHYTGSSTYTPAHFSVLMCESTDFELHNVRIEASNIRYCVHDEAQGVGTYTHVYDNCKMVLDNRNNVNNLRPCIGGGMGEHAIIRIIGGHYKSYTTALTPQDQSGTITYHNPISGTGSTFKNELNCTGVVVEDGTIYYSVLGDSLELSDFIVNNCLLAKAPFINGAGVPGLNQNVQMFEWNNVIR